MYAGHKAFGGWSGVRGVVVVGVGVQGGTRAINSNLRNVCTHLGGHAPFEVVLFFSQLGTFRSSEGEYFVEPLHSYNGEHYEEEHIKPHIVYRKDAHRRAKEDESLCDTAGKKVHLNSLFLSFFLFFLENLSQQLTDITFHHKC